MVRLSALFLGSLLLATPLRALAEPDAVEHRQIEAKKACLTGRTQQGIDILAELFTETNDPNYVYNQGRCYQQNNRGEEAISRFREYLRISPDLNPREVSEVEGFIAELQRQHPLPAVAPPPEVASSPPMPAPLAGPPLPTGAASDPASLASASSTGHAWRVAGALGVGVGLVALGGGVVMGLRARSLADGVSTTYDQSKYDSGRHAETLQWVGYGVGAAALGGGLLSYWLAAHSERRGEEVALAPMLSAQVGGAWLRGRF